MIDALATQVAFLLFEAVFCFIASILALSNESHQKRVRFPIMALNLLAGLLLAADSLAYIYRGRDTQMVYVMNHLSNFVVFAVSVLILPVYAVYVTVRVYGDFSLRRKAPARKRLIACMLLSAIGFALVILSQFYDFYYIIDDMNNYHRGPWFLLSLVFPAAVSILVVTILIENRRKLGIHQFLVLASYLIFPAIGLLLQVFFYGLSYMNMGIGISAILMFIEGTISKNNELRHVARTEMRTGIANEHGCVEWLNNMRGQPRLLDYTAVFFDLCKFSDINRKYGMENGNVVLANYALTLTEHLDKDELLARQYGNQFVAVIKNGHVPDFLSLLSGLSVSFYDKREGDVMNVSVSARAGVFRVDRKDLDGEEIISCAAIGLAMAKAQADGSVIYITREILDELEKRKKLEKDINHGLKTGAFVAYYQPKVDARTHKLCGAEALARWSREGLVLSPGQFIPLMEENRTICTLDLLILSEVCKDIASWIEQGLEPITVSVNFSRRNLADPDIVDRIHEIIKKSGIPKHLIEIEVTETADEFPIHVLKRFVDSLHQYGYLVSIDDFGCASSSLTLLREITFDTIKIDKGFIDKDYPKDLTILEHIVKMAKSLELTIVAEGIEHEEQVRTLLNMGVSIIQGYYFDRPMPIDEMTRRLVSPQYA
ncbi:MAG: EAL domain-containing protein [Clostridiales bacterium]|nr:EAL domain-containing protein [Clostridiales bacterium]